MSPSDRIIVIGGGPAGMSCALWLKNYGLSPIIVEASAAMGGMQNLSYVSNTWLLGWQAVRGHDLAEKFSAHIHYSKIQTLFNASLIAMDRSKFPDRIIMSIQIAGERIQTLEVCAAVIATGTRFKGHDWHKNLLECTGCEDRIFYGPAAYSDPTRWFGGNPLIVGGGDSAVEGACFLADRGMNPTVIVRKPVFQAGQENLRRFLEYQHLKKLDVIMADEINAMKSNGGSHQIEIHTKAGNVIYHDSVLLLLGYEPNADFFQNDFFGAQKIATDANGYITIDSDCMTSLPGIYAIGDVANPKDPCTATAIAMGTIAARRISQRFNDDTGKDHSREIWASR